MAQRIAKPTIITAAGSPPKRIEEFIGRANTATESVSVARMVSPSGWAEPAQTPEFDEYTVVLRGTLRIETSEGSIDVSAGEAAIVPSGESVRYSTPCAE